LDNDKTSSKLINQLKEEKFDQLIYVHQKDNKELYKEDWELNKSKIIIQIMVKTSYFKDFVKYFKIIFGLELKRLTLLFEIPSENKEFLEYFETIKEYKQIFFFFNPTYFETRDFEIKRKEKLYYKKNEYLLFKNHKNVSISIDHPDVNEFIKDVNFDSVEVCGSNQTMIQYSERKEVSIKDLKWIDFSILRTKELKINKVDENEKEKIEKLIDYLKNYSLDTIIIENMCFNQTNFLDLFLKNIHEIDIKIMKIVYHEKINFQQIFDCFNYITIVCSIKEYFHIIIKNKKNKNITLDKIFFDNENHLDFLIEFLNNNIEIKTIGFSEQCRFDISKNILFFKKLKYVENVLIYNVGSGQFGLNNVLFYSIQKFLLYLNQDMRVIDIYINPFSFYLFFLNFDLNFFYF
jgi:hypothetical protein